MIQNVLQKTHHDKKLINGTGGGWYTQQKKCESCIHIWHLNPFPIDWSDIAKDRSVFLPLRANNGSKLSIILS